MITGGGWYGPGFYGNRTATGKRSARNGDRGPSHPSIRHQVRVTNLWNGRSAVIRINDRGPFIHHRVIDLGHGAARSWG